MKDNDKSGEDGYVCQDSDDEHEKDECECHGCDEEKEIEEALGSSWYEYGPIRNAILSAVITGATFAISIFISVPNFIAIPAYLIAIVLGGYIWIKEGIEDLMYERKVGIGILMLVATAGAAILGLWEEAAFLAFLYGAAEGIEEYTYARTRGSIRALMDLVPREATVIKDGKETIVPAIELREGDVFIVRPGESLATDGTIIKGRSSLDEAPVTGESMPVSKNAGASVYAGTLNLNGVLEVKATSSFDDNTVSKIIHLVEEAQERKGNAQQFIDRFGDRYSPLVLVAGLLLMAIPYLNGWDGSEWFERAIIFLVAAAPCALVMSTPVAIAAGIGRSGKNGVLIKGGIHLETLGKVKVVAFDKTGTLTMGKPQVTDIVNLNGNENEILRLASSVEYGSEHSLARAVMDRARSAGVDTASATGFQSLVGQGAKATVDGVDIFVGSPEMFKDRKNFINGSKEAERFRLEGKTVDLVGTAESVIGVIAFKDQIRPESKRIITEIRAMGIEVAMLTGDNEATASSVAKELGIDEVLSGLRPEDKIVAIMDLRSKYGTVAMVGDGINDAPALAESSVGIAMGVAGTDAAIEAADVALMADELTKLPYALRIGRKANVISKQNIVFSLIALAILIPSSLSGILTVASAVLLHESSELIAVGNGLRTRVRDD
ncbi:MAG: heavy metal translocating P-type ATPase [Euryarchaeota archaeon]|nr:heavy metal translocating P-type ATPase [Euryarchaeota archaeon]